MKIGWYVFIRRPGGGAIPIAGFWRKRTALRWARLHAEPDHCLEVHRYVWWRPVGAGGRAGSVKQPDPSPAVRDLDDVTDVSHRP